MGHLKSKNIKFEDLAEWKNYSTAYPRGMAYTDFIKTQMEPKGLSSSKFKTIML